MLFRSKSKAVDPIDAKAMIDRGTMLIDVREISEWNAGHAPEAVHIPLASLAVNLSRVPRDEDVLVCCKSGNRSSSAVALLSENGFNAINVTGGMSKWDASGLPVVNTKGYRGSVG